MYHPRAQLRSEIKALIEAAVPGVPVLDSAISDIDGSPVTILIRSVGETVERAPGSGQRPGTPLVRRMQTEVIVVSIYDGDGPEAQLQADDHARQVELAMNMPFDPGLDLVAIDIAQDDGEKTVVQISMLYETKLTDPMERN